MSSENYTPRRASKRWLEGAPSYVLDCLDSGDKVADRYTVLFTGDLLLRSPAGSKRYADTYVQYLGMSGAPTHPQGFSQWGELAAHNAAMYRYRSKHARVRWLDLPAHIRRHVIGRATEAEDGATDISRATTHARLSAGIAGYNVNWCPFDSEIEPDMAAVWVEEFQKEHVKLRKA